jgi:hypothetical protein
VTKEVKNYSIYLRKRENGISPIHQNEVINFRPTGGSFANGCTLEGRKSGFITQMNLMLVHIVGIWPKRLVFARFEIISFNVYSVE